VGNLTAALMAVIPFFAIPCITTTALTFEEIENYKGHFAVILHMQVFFPHATCAGNDQRFRKHKAIWQAVTEPSIL
jgi:hypothetical protein